MKRGGFVSDVRRAWRWFSVQGLAFLSVMPALYENVDVLRDLIPQSEFNTVISIIAALTLIARLVKQQ